MSKTATIQVRIDAQTKRAAGKLFEDLGLDFSQAIRIYLRKVIDEQGIPFRITSRRHYK